jgi:hypothetical protein
MRQEIIEPFGHRLATVNDVAVLVDEVQSRIASGIATGGAEQLVESMIGHVSRSA